MNETDYPVKGSSSRNEFRASFSFYSYTNKEKIGGSYWYTKAKVSAFNFLHFA